MRDANPPHLRIEMINQPRYLAGIRETMCSVAERLGFNQRDACQIALAVDEAICNVIKHGYDEREEGRIWLSIWPIEGQEDGSTGIRIVVEDEGRQVDPEEICSRDLDDVRPGGLGVHIMRQVMDRVEYSRRAEVGMRLVLEKLCVAEGAEESANPCS